MIAMPQINDTATVARQGVFTLRIKDKNALYAAYLSFVHNGGLFIPTTRRYRLGDELLIQLKLLNEEDKIPILGRVIWITPAGAQGGRAAGVGLQFQGREGESARTRIEAYLAGALESDRPTHTM